jgi:SAM-dependent methyltransferase
MSHLGDFHKQYVHTRRVHMLCEWIANLIPPNAQVLDVGCGDGLLARMIMDQRADVEISGIDVLVRSGTAISVCKFDGSSIPFPDKTFDAVMFIDVLHHTENQMRLLSEAARVTRNTIVIKDHRLNGPLAGPTLRLMDWMGNARHGVALPYDYWSEDKWTKAFSSLNLVVETWNTDLKLYPSLPNLIFGRSLHFLARLKNKNANGVASEHPNNPAV